MRKFSPIYGIFGPRKIKLFCFVNYCWKKRDLKTLIVNTKQISKTFREARRLNFYLHAGDKKVSFPNVSVKLDKSSSRDFEQLINNFSLLGIAMLCMTIDYCCSIIPWSQPSELFEQSLTFCSRYLQNYLLYFDQLTNELKQS